MTDVTHQHIEFVCRLRADHVLLRCSRSDFYTLLKAYRRVRDPGALMILDDEQLAKTYYLETDDDNVSKFRMLIESRDPSC